MSGLENTYADREIDEKFLDIKDSLNRIEAQTVKTNGSVAKIKLWQSYVIGFCACLGIMLISVIIPLFATYLQIHHN